MKKNIKVIITLSTSCLQMLIATGNPTGNVSASTTSSSDYSGIIQKQKKDIHDYKVTFRLVEKGITKYQYEKLHALSIRFGRKQERQRVLIVFEIQKEQPKESIEEQEICQPETQVDFSHPAEKFLSKEVDLGYWVIDPQGVTKVSKSELFTECMELLDEKPTENKKFLNKLSERFLPRFGDNEEYSKKMFDKFNIKVPVEDFQAQISQLPVIIDQTTNWRVAIIGCRGIMIDKPDFVPAFAYYCTRYPESNRDIMDDNQEFKGMFKKALFGLGLRHLIPPQIVIGGERLDLCGANDLDCIRMIGQWSTLAIGRAQVFIITKEERNGTTLSAIEIHTEIEGNDEPGTGSAGGPE